MAKISLPFWNNGLPFSPKIYPDDLADYEDAEVKALESKRLSSLVKAKAAFVEVVLRRETPGTATTMASGTAGVSITATIGATGPVLKLTAAEVNLAWHELWTKGQDGRDPDAPLGRVGGSSAPSPSQG